MWFLIKNFSVKSFGKKFVTFLQLWKKLMHKNAIKMVGRVIFLENSEFFDKNLAENLCFSRVLRLFASCFSCYFGSTFVFFKKKFLGTLIINKRNETNARSNSSETILETLARNKQTITKQKQLIFSLFFQIDRRRSWSSF